MAVKKDQVQVTVLLDGKKAINELGMLEMEANDLKLRLKDLKRGTDEWNAASQKLTQTTAKVKAMREQMGLAGMTMQQLRRYQRDLYREIDTGATKGTARYNELAAKIREVNGAITAQRAQVRGLNTFWKQIGSSFSAFGPVALLTTAIYSVTAAVRGFYKENIELSETLADVQKNTNLTAREVDELTESLLQMDTRSSRQELLEMAIVAGKLGIQGKHDIESFVAAADQINVALGEDLGGVESLRTLGKLISTFKVKDAYGIETALLKVGSAVNTLGRSSEAKEANIVEFARRMGGIAPQAKVSIANILGLGAAADKLGQTMEVAGTAMSQIFNKLVANREAYAQFAKDTDGNSISLAEFSNLIDNDFNGALLAVFRGLKGNSQSMTQFIDSLGDMGLEGQRVIQVIGTLANNVEEVVKQQAISNEEFQKGTSIAEENALKNNTVGASLAKIGKWLAQPFTNNGIVRAFEDMARWAAKFVEVPMSEKLEDERMKLNVYGLELKDVNISQERRLEIVEDLQKMYPQYLGYIDKEKVTNENLQEVLSMVNEELITRIVLTRKQEELQEQAEKVADKKLEIDEQEVALRKTMVELQEKYNLEVADGLTLSEQAQSMVDQLNKMQASGQIRAPKGRLFSPVAQLANELRQLETNREWLDSYNNVLQMITDERDRWAAEFKKKQEENTALLVPVGADTPLAPLKGGEGAAAGLTEEQKKALEAYEKWADKLKELRAELDRSMLESEQREVAEIEAKYEKLLNEAVEFHKDGTTSEAEYLATIVGLNEAMAEEVDYLFAERSKKYAETRKKLQDEMALELMGDKDREIAQVTTKYDRLIDEAKAYNLAVVDLERAKAEAIDAINDEYRQRDLDKTEEANKEKWDNWKQLGNDIGGILTSLSDLQDDSTERGIRGQRDLANASVIASNVAVAAEQAMALSAAITAAVKAGSYAGPGAIFAIPLAITALVGTVLAAFGSIRSNNQQAQSALSSLREERKKKAAPSFYHGGETGTTTMGFGDMWGDYTGFTHADEYVVSHTGRQTPTMMNAIALDKMRMNGVGVTTPPAPLKGGGGAPPGGQLNGGLSSAEVERLTVMMGKLEVTIDVLIRDGIRSYFSGQAYEDVKEFYEWREENRSRGRVRR